MATIIDCHAICTAMAYGYNLADQVIGSAPHIWYATGKLSLTYLKPVPIEKELALYAAITGHNEKHVYLNCTLNIGDKTYVEAEVDAVRVPSEWMQ
ncbi:hypothetical protein GCM10007877_11990 [Marinibactrum halimedae]|uniref:PaaI family thioesterase n=2 Tax=Marinibactrum halimedae TaxID=1444977 RepID=A0AA37T1R5_9GAMM|nr:hypothetical protein GCM10007877_11990 [Marinibactrum halimedae]